MTTLATPTRTTADDEAAELVAAYAAADPGDAGRARLRARAIEAWLPLAKHLARRYAGRGESIEDLTQVATIGLIKAVDRYDAGRGVDFTSFAIPTIIGEVKRHFRDKTWAVRVPRRLQELRLEITAANSTLVHTLGRSPTVADVAAHLGITEEEVLEGLEGACAYTATSLSTPVHDGAGSAELGDLFGAEDHGFEMAEFRVALVPALATLDERERTILALRFRGNLSQSEIAERVGVSQMHVSRLLTRALAKLRTQFTADTPVARR